MATTEERREIYRQATGYVDPNAPTAEETAAHALLDRIEVFLWSRINTVMVNGDTDSNRKTLKLASRGTVESRDMARRLLIILLGAPQAAAATPTAIRAFDDAGIDTILTGPVLSNFAEGLTLSRV